MTEQELIKRLEAATGPSRELDLAIANVDAEYPWRWYNADQITVTTDQYGRGAVGNPISSLEYFTGVTDDALSLVPGDAFEEMKRTPHRKGWRVNLWNAFGVGQSADHSDLPIALCIAALKARAHQRTQAQAPAKSEDTAQAKE